LSKDIQYIEPTARVYWPGFWSRYESWKHSASPHAWVRWWHFWDMPTDASNVWLSGRSEVLRSQPEWCEWTLVTMPMPMTIFSTVCSGASRPAARI